MNSSEQHKVGPRAKCDQVVYETIAKAAEIIVRGRCRCEGQSKNTSAPGTGTGMNNTSTSTYNTNTNTSTNRTTSTTTTASTTTGTSRFHLEVEEVTTVRSILQMWKRSLHVPLRLDVYYEYCTDPTQPEQTTKKELLERWCIDYLPSQDHMHNGNGNGNVNGNGNSGHNTSHSSRHNADETLAQLRQVVKRVVIQLRVLFALTRMMPAYRLHHALMDDFQHGNRNHVLSNLNRPLGSGPGLGGGYYQNTTSPISMGVPNQMDNNNSNNANGGSTTRSSTTNTSYRDLVGGQINFSFYVSDTATDATLFSSSTNSPFARHDLDPIPTPFGLLRLTGLFDESLNVEGVLTNRARRILEWGQVQGGQVPVPVQVPVSWESQSQQLQGQFQQQQQMQVDGGDYHYHQHQQQQQQHHAQEPTRSRAIPIQGSLGQSNHSGVPEMAQGQGSTQSFHNRSRSHEHQRPQYLKQMSMPNPNPMNLLSASPNVVSEHFVQNYAAAMDRPKSADPGHHQIRDRLSSDPGMRLVSGGKEKRVLSGLSLALMNEEAKEQRDRHATMPGVEGATPPSPLIQPMGSGEDVASLKQRMAFHHPPPSFDSEQSLSHAGSASPKQYMYMQMAAQPSSLYGYGYNNGNVIPPPKASNFGSTTTSRANSPMPFSNTPPQPMFISSLRGPGFGGTHKFSPSDQVTGGIGGMMTSKQSRDDEIPFRNPTSLQQAPSVDAGSSMASGNNSIPLPAQNSYQIQSTVNTAMVQGGRDAILPPFLPPLTTLDALASSPFKLPVSQSVTGAANSTGVPLSSSPGASVFASLVMGKGSAAYSPFDEGFPLALTSGGASAAFSASSLMPNRSNSEYISRSGGGNQAEKEDDYDDMPFAVDVDFYNQVSLVGGMTSTGSTPKVSGQNSTAGLGSSSGTNTSSQVVTSLAHRCSTAGRLKLFSSGMNEGVAHGNSVLDKSIVEDQLRDFRSFGESITASGLLPPATR